MHSAIARTIRIPHAGLVAGLTVLVSPGAGAMAAAATPELIVNRTASDGWFVAVSKLKPPARAGDATPALQKAIDDAAAKGGGVIFLEAGVYHLHQPIVVREGVVLRGVRCGDRAPELPVDPARCTVLALYWGREAPDAAPAVTLERGTGLRDLVFWYPEQRPDHIVPYAWTVRSSQKVTGDNTTIMDVLFVNPYQAIRIGPEWNELHTIRNVTGTPLKTGLYLDTTTDIGRVVDVHFAPDYWERSGLGNAPDSGSRKALRTFLLREGVGADIGRSDWEYLYALKVDGYGVGLRFRQGARGTTNAVMFGCEFRKCDRALVIDRLNGIGLAASGCRFDARSVAVDAPRSFTTVAQFNGCVFRTASGPAVHLDGSGLLTFQNCTFEAWGAGEGHVAVEASNGSVSLIGPRFAAAGAAVHLGAGLQRARILLSEADDPGRRVRNEASEGADVVMGVLTQPCARADMSAPEPPPTPRAARPELFNAAKYGVRPGTGDNTAALQAALDAAGEAGGGIVYVGPGYYRFAGALRVPSGVELRGSWDVPHHTVSAGTVLMPVGGSGDEDGTPFLSLQPGSGLRGFTVWYPEQNLLRPRPYPWAVRALGPRCWVVDVTLGNAWQGVDFWSHPSDGHFVRYLAGAMLRRGLRVSKCSGRGWVEDVQFNPHYSVRLPGDMPRPDYGKHDVGGRVIDTQRKQLQGLVFGRCADETLVRTFLYAAWDGLAFLNDDGGTNARIIEHGTDTGSRALFVERTGDRGLDFINAQLVPLGKYVQSAIVTPKTFRGDVRLFNSQVWAGPSTAIVDGEGSVLIQQMNTLSGPITVRGGRFVLENTNVARRLSPHVDIRRGAKEVRVLACVHPGGAFEVRNRAGDRAWIRACAATITTGSKAPVRLVTGWEPGELQGRADRVAQKGGGIRAVANAHCRVVATQHAHSGEHALLVEGEAKERYAFVYFQLFNTPVSVRPDTTLTWWLRPENDLGRSVGIDLLFYDGTVLRDTAVKDTDGHGVHPSRVKGEVGRWTKFVVPLGTQFTGRTIVAIMAAYDSRRGPGRFCALIDDLSIVSKTRAWFVQAEPAGGRLAAGASVRLLPVGDSPDAVIRYTLDGTNPTARSRRYRSPIRFDRPGLAEIRAVVFRDDRPGPVRSFLYNVEE